MCGRSCCSNRICGRSFSQGLRCVVDPAVRHGMCGRSCSFGDGMCGRSCRRGAGRVAGPTAGDRMCGRYWNIPVLAWLVLRADI
jgi:hypothetical protein